MVGVKQRENASNSSLGRVPMVAEGELGCEKKKVRRPARAAPRSSRAEQIWRAVSSAGSMVTQGRVILTVWSLADPLPQLPRELIGTQVALW